MSMVMSPDKKAAEAARKAQEAEAANAAREREENDVVAEESTIVSEEQES
jgi:hypothetical protein